MIDKNKDGSINAITNELKPMTRFPGPEVAMVGNNLLKTLYQLGMIQAGVIVGSTRRGEALVKDLELLVAPKYGVSIHPVQGQLFGPAGPGSALSSLGLPPDPVNLFEELESVFLDTTPLDKADKDGPKQKTYWWPWPDQKGSRLKVEIYLVHHQSAWGLQMIIRTGPVEFNKFLMAHILKQGWHSSNGFLHGHGKHPSQGYRGQCQRDHECPQLINCPTEESVFEALDLVPIPPGIRTTENLKKAIREKYRRNKK